MRELALKVAQGRARADCGIGELLASAAAIERWLAEGIMPEEVTPDCKADRSCDEDQVLSHT